MPAAGAAPGTCTTTGTLAPNPSMTDRIEPFSVPDPPQGKFAVVTDTNKPGTRIMFRDVTLDGPLILHLTVFYERRPRR